MKTDSAAALADDAPHLLVVDDDRRIRDLLSRFELAKDLRASSNVPIVMLTARDEAASRIEGLTIGADDYVGKPFEPRELSLRIANILKRASPATTPPVESVCFGDFRFHIARGELRRGDARRNRAAPGARGQRRRDRRARRRRAGQSAAPQDRA